MGLSCPRKSSATACGCAMDSLLTTSLPNVTAAATGSWLTTLPNSLNGTVLSKEEFRDSLRLRYGLTPHNLPAKCDGCGSPFSVEHALSCRLGGLILLRHNDMAKEWGELCANAFTNSAVSDKPLIDQGRDKPATGSNGAQIEPDLRGDIGVHGFWKRGISTIFDIRISDTDAPSYHGQNPAKILEQGKKAKKQKYSAACAARCRHFTPLVFSVDGLRGTEANAASKRLAALLSTKWKRTYSEVCGFVRSRILIALVRAASLCLRGACDPTDRCSAATWESGSGLSLYRLYLLHFSMTLTLE